MIEVSKKAVLLDKAIADFYIAESIYTYRPDFALYHLNQSIEKLIKGALRCYGNEFEHDHNIRNGVSVLSEKVKLSDQLIKNCEDIENFSSSLRYVNRASDPTQETAKATIEKVRIIMDEISRLPEVQKYYNEAHQLNLKLLQNSDSMNKPDLKRKPLDELLREVKQNKSKKKDNNKQKLRKQEHEK